LPKIKLSLVRNISLFAVAILGGVAGCSFTDMGSGAFDEDPLYDGGAVADSSTTDTSADVSQAQDAASDTSVDAVFDSSDSSPSSDADASPFDAPLSDASDSEQPDTGAPDAPFSDAYDASDSGLPDTGAPDAPQPTTSAIYTTTIAGNSQTVDRVRPSDGAIAPDGVIDGTFVVTAYGEFVGFAMISTDASGTPAGISQWDTYVGSSKIPAGIGLNYLVGSSTWQLGIWEGSTILNKSDGSLSPTSLGFHTLMLYASNSGNLGPGKHFRVVAELADHTLIRGPVVAF